MSRRCEPSSPCSGAWPWPRSARTRRAWQRRRTPALASQTPSRARSAKSVSVRPGSRMIEPAWTRIPPGGNARTICPCRDGQSLDAGRILGPPRDMNLGCADAGRDATVRIALEKTDRLLPRCIIAERDVHVRIDEPRHGHHPPGVDRDVTVGGRATRSHGRDAVAFHQDAVAGNHRCIDIAGQDRSDVEDGQFHARADAPALRAATASWVKPPTRALRRPRLARQKMTATSSGIGASGRTIDMPS